MLLIKGETEKNFADAVATGSSSAESLFPDIFQAAVDWPSYVLIDKQFWQKAFVQILKFILMSID